MGHLTFFLTSRISDVHTYSFTAISRHRPSLVPSLLSSLGLLTTPISIEGHAWPRSAEGDPLWPEVQMGFTPFTIGNDYGLITQRVLGIDRNVSG